jgi:hypothetical protein
MLNRVPLAELAETVAWVARELRLVAHDDTISREDLDSLEAFAVRRLEEASTSNGGSSGGSVAARTPRKGSAKDQALQASAQRIHAYLVQFPGSSISEVALALKMAITEVTAASRRVGWLLLSEEEREEPTERVESDAIGVTRDRARGALQAASLMVAPLSHQAYTTLLRNGRVKGPSVARITQLFGSWSAACNEVGVATGDSLRSHYERQWTADDLLVFVEEFLRHPDFSGASHQYDEWRTTQLQTRKVPSLGTVRNIVGGTWNDIRTAALRRMRATWAS